MNILLINHYAGSIELGMEYRPFFMGMEWVKKGHNVTVLSASFAHVRMKQPPVKEDFTEEFVGGIRYCWFKTPAYKGNGIDRLRNMIAFSWKIYRFANLLANKFKPEVVIASSTYTYDNYAAHRIAKESGAMYAYEVHDLWPLSPIELGGMSKLHPFIISLQHAENYAYKHADKVISMLPKTLSYMKDHGLNEKKWHYVPNGVHSENRSVDILLPKEQSELLNGLKKNNKKIIMYAGSIGVANDLDNLVESARSLNDPSIAFVIIGDGPEKEKVVGKTKKLKLNNIYFLDPVSKSKIPGILNFADVLYIGLQNQPLFRYGISPNKMLDYMMAGKPIIQAIEAGNNMVREANCGISIKPGDPEALAEAIIKIFSIPENERKKMGVNGKSFVKKNHDYSILADKMLTIFRSQDYIYDNRLG